MGKPLEGVRILDLSVLLAGPFGSMILADLGADVIKIELPGREDQARHMPPHYVGETSAYFVAFNRNKRSLALNLKDEEGYRLFLELVKRSDVVYDNFRPGVLERLRADYETLRKVNPRIISASVTGYGLTGPEKDKPVLDLIVQARGGIMSFTGEPGRPPVRMGVPMGDMGGSLFVAHGILAALYQRERTGAGQKVDVSLLDCQIYLSSYRAQYYLTGGEVARPLGTSHPSVVPIRAYECGDGRWVVLDCALQHFWEGLCEALGHSEWREDPKMLEPAPPPGQPRLRGRQAGRDLPGGHRRPLACPDGGPRGALRTHPEHRRGPGGPADPGAGDGGRDGAPRPGAHPDLQHPHQDRGHLGDAPRAPASLGGAHRGDPPRGARNAR